jgi:hypothetical protein
MIKSGRIAKLQLAGQLLYEKRESTGWGVDTDTNRMLKSRRARKVFHPTRNARVSLYCNIGAA